MNYTLNTYTRLLTQISIFICIFPISAMHQETMEAEYIQNALQEQRDKGIIEGYFSCRGDHANSFYKKCPLSDAFNEGKIDYIARLPESDPRSNSRLYEIQYSWKPVSNNAQEIHPTIHRKSRGYVAHFIGNSLAPDSKSKEYVIAIMLAASDAFMCPLSTYTDPHTHGGFMILNHKKHLGSTKDVNWKEQETYESLGKFLSVMHNTTVEKPPMNSNNSFYNLLNEDKHREAYGCITTSHINWKSHISHITAQLTFQKEFARDKDEYYEATFLLDHKLPSILKQIEEIDAALSTYTNNKLAHGNLDACHLQPLIDSKTKKVRRWYSYDWSRAWLTHEFYDFAFVEAAWVPKEMRQVFWNAFWGDRQPTPQENAQLTIMRVLAPLVSGLIYGSSYPSHFAAHFTKQVSNPNLAVAQQLMHKGFDYKAPEEFAELGAALLFYGLKKMYRPDIPACLKLLKEQKKNNAAPKPLAKEQPVHVNIHEPVAEDPAYQGECALQ